MFGSIDKLRKKDERQKRRFAFLIAAVVTLIIFGIWLLSFSVTNIEEPEEAEISSISPDSPLENFWQNFKSGIKEIRSTVKEIEDIDNF